jgi:UDP-glucose 4-epimerase
MDKLNISLINSVPTKLADAYRGKTILITGGRGYIGSALTQFFVEIDCKLILMDQSPVDSWMPQSHHAEITFFHGDVCNRQAWKSVMPGVDYLFHLAALEYQRSGYDMMRDLQVNAISVMNFLEVCRENDLRPKVVFSSSTNLFGLVDTWPVNENIRDNPPSLWSIHKLMAENYLRVYGQKNGIKSVSLRLANVYGPTTRKDAVTRVVINKMIAKALAGEILNLYTNQCCIRDYIFIEDAVRAFLFAGAEKKIPSDGEFYIIGCEEGKTIAEVWRLIANKIKELTDKDIHIEFDETVKVEPLDMRNFIADTTKFRQRTGWKPLVPLEEGIEVTVKYLTSIL